MKKSVLASAAAGLFLFGGSASAAFINGSLSLTGGFDSLPTAPSSYVVSQLTAIDVQSAAFATGGTTDFAGSGGVGTAFDFDITSLPSDFFTTADGFSFKLTDVTVNSSSPLSCDAQGLCGDAIAFDIKGIVSKAGFDDTAFAGTWTANGTCQGNGTCTSNISGSWSGSLTALGVAAPPPPPTGVPEPGPLALMGLGLLGLMRFGRRQA